MTQKQLLPVYIGLGVAAVFGVLGADTLAAFSVLIGATVMLWVKP